MKYKEGQNDSHCFFVGLGGNVSLYDGVLWTEKYVRLVRDMYESSREVHCRSEGWLQSGDGTASRISLEPLFCCVMDRLTDEVRQDDNVCR